MTDTKVDAARALEISDMCRPILAGHPPEVQGAALAELTVQWILGHHPDTRAKFLTVHFKAVAFMVHANIAAGYDPWAKRDDDAEKD